MRRHARFNGTPEEHRASAQNRSVRTRVEIRSFNRALRAGRCQLALHALMRASFHAGRFSENRLWADKARWARGGAADSAMVRMTSRYHAKCGKRS